MDVISVWDDQSENVNDDSFEESVPSSQYLYPVDSYSTGIGYDDYPDYTNLSSFMNDPEEGFVDHDYQYHGYSSYANSMDYHSYHAPNPDVLDSSATRQNDELLNDIEDIIYSDIFSYLDPSERGNNADASNSSKAVTESSNIPEIDKNFQEAKLQKRMDSVPKETPKTAIKKERLLSSGNLKESFTTGTPVAHGRSAVKAENKIEKKVDPELRTISSTTLEQLLCANKSTVHVQEAPHKSGSLLLKSQDQINEVLQEPNPRKRKYQESPSTNPEDERSRKNALNAKMNRDRQKKYISDLENLISNLLSENSELTRSTALLKKEEEKLKLDVDRLKAMLLAAFPLTFLTDSGNVNATKAWDGGLCLHVRGDSTLLKFCQHCSALSQLQDPS